MSQNGLDNPFVGLRPFESDESLLFFGREEQTIALLDRLRQYRFVAVVGSSGSGKSSLVRAGLIPQLKAGFLVADRVHWREAIMKPGNTPRFNLAEALLSAQSEAYSPHDIAALHDAIVGEGSRAIQKALEPLFENDDTNLLLLVDQFEEIFRFRNLSTDGKHQNEAADFVSIMLGLAERRRLPIYVVMTMRSDYLGDCDVFHGLPEALNRSQYLVPRLTRKQLRAAIEGPIRLPIFDHIAPILANPNFVRIAPILVDRFLNDAGRGNDQLPVIQHALNRTWAYWNQGQPEGPLNVNHYEAIGTLDRALDKHAEEIYDELGDENEQPSRKQEICETIFKALTDLDIDDRGIRRPTKLGTLCALAGARQAEVIEVIDIFRKPGCSFLVPPAGEKLEAETVIDISHESLMRVWKRLELWVDKEARSARSYLGLAETALQWHKHGKTKSYLYRGSRLTRIDLWWKQNHPDLEWAQRYHPEYELAKTFLAKSRAGRRKGTLIRAGIAILAIGTLFILGQLVLERGLRLRAEQAELAAQISAIEATTERDRANALRIEAQASEIEALRQQGFAEAAADRAEASEAEALRQKEFAEDAAGRAEASEAEALRQQRFAQFNAEEATNARRQTLGVSLASQAKRQLDNGNAELGALLARQAFLFNQESGGEFLNEVYDALRQTLDALEGSATSIVLRPHSDDPLEDASVRAVAYSPDGLWIAAAGNDGLLRVWDRSNGDAARFLEDHGERTSSLVFSPDGALLVSASDDQTLHVWQNLGAISPDTTILRRHEGRIQAVAFRWDGRRIISAGDDGTLLISQVSSLLKIDTRGTSLSLPDGGLRIRTLAYSPDGATLAAGTDDGLWLLEPIAPNRQWTRVPGQDGQVDAVAFSPSGLYLAAGGLDTVVRVWRLDDLDSPVELRGHEGPINALTYGPYGSTLASGSSDKTVRLWPDNSDGPIILRGHDDWVRAVAFGPYGNQLVSGSADQTVRVWNVNAEELADEVCNAVDRWLTELEWITFIGPDISYNDYEPCPLEFE